MKNLVIPKNYKSKLSLIETEIAIKVVKDTFEKQLAKSLNLTRVSAPLFVLPQTGLNDNLNGFERPVSFDVPAIKDNVEIVQSLAKWKRAALKKYGFNVNAGLYTDMNAIRRDEELDSIHSIYVDQWDWEKIITAEQRKLSFLKGIVKKIYKAMLITEKQINKAFPILTEKLPKEITFVSTQELENRYPNKTDKEKENLITKEYGSIFLYQIGWPLKSGNPHDGRAADYDDWKLNGDILVWCETLGIALELSSMGIRVDEVSILKQLEQKNEMHKLNNPYVQGILNKSFPLTIGGGIGQSRLCLFFLEKMHIGEVQSSLWSLEDIDLLEKNNINLL